MNAVVELKPQGGALINHAAGGRMAVADVVSHALAVQEVQRAVMKPDVHYGKIPGTPKPTLYKPGAEMLCMVFHIAPSYEVEDLSTPDSIRYRVTCVGTHQTTGVVMGEAMGEASSSEEKYKWRKAVCDEEFEDTPPNMRRVKYGKGQGGVYRQKQIRTEPADLANTVLKMANKRAQIAMVLNVLAASDMFSQDLEDLSAELRDQLARQEQAGEQQQEPPPPAGPAAWPDDKLEQRFPKAREWLAAGKTHDDILQFLETKGALSDAQKAKVRALTPAAPQPAAADVQDVAPKITYASVADAIVHAASLDVLSQAEDLIGQLADAQQRTDAVALAKDRRAYLEERAR